MFFNGLTPEKEKCCGCSACVKVCPVKALRFGIDEEGFEYPFVDPDVCIECGACEKVCPMVNSAKAVASHPGHAYAAVSKNKDILMRSSSGGIFGVIAAHILDKGGYVFGAAYDEKLKVRHIGISRREDLPQLQESKYVQSKNENVYVEIRELLKKGVPVYYCGVGCQVAGLKLFLHKDYDNLITTDIFCHGVPPQRVFDALIGALTEKYKHEIICYNFRSKSIFGWGCDNGAAGYLEKGNMHIIGYDPYMASYFHAFLNNYMYRESCYVCPFAQKSRSGDITLGDFWGVEKYIKVADPRAGVSAIMVNTEKGKKLLEEIMAGIDLYDADIKDIAVINKTLTAPSPRPAERDSFFRDFNSRPDMIAKDFAVRDRKKALYASLKKNPLTRPLFKIYFKLKK